MRPNDRFHVHRIKFVHDVIHRDDEIIPWNRCEKLGAKNKERINKQTKLRRNFSVDELHNRNSRNGQVGYQYLVDYYD